MKPLVGLLLFITAGACVAAETYKWVDEKGVINYGEKPPTNRQARPVNTQPGAVLETGGQFGRKAETDMGRSAAEPRQAQGPAEPMLAPGLSTLVRGMDFDVYIRLQRGMTEGELLLRAGRPDHESLENAWNEIVKTYYYFPTTANPFTTVVTLRGGRIDSVDRIKKF